MPMTNGFHMARGSVVLWIVCTTVLVQSVLSVEPPRALSAEMTAAELLGNIERSRSRISTLEMTVTYEVYESPTYLKQRYEQDLGQGLATDIVKRYFGEDILALPGETHRERNRVLIDTEGRGRIEIVRTETRPNGDIKDGDLDANIHQVTIWDGDTGLLYDPPHNSASISTTRPIEHSDRFRQPWQQFGGNFARMLREALDREVEVAVTVIEDDNVYRIEFEGPRQGELIAHVSPSQGYSVMSQEFRRNGRVLLRYDAEFKEYPDGIWLPFRGKDERYASEGELLSSASILVNEVRVNDPEFVRHVLELVLSEGTLIVDHLIQEKYQLQTSVTIGHGGVFGSAPLNDIVNRAVADAHAQIELPAPVRRRVPTEDGPASFSGREWSNPLLMAASVITSLGVASLVLWRRHTLTRNRKS